LSNTLAIATVTETLRHMIYRALPGSGVGGAHVTTVRLDNKANLPSPGVNIFLYQVTINAAWQNADLSTRRADGSLLRRPQAAFDLHYLLTFHGEDATLDQQRLLGATLLELHAAPILSREIVQQVQDHVSFLNQSNLADQIDVVRVTPANLSLEDLNKVWMTFPTIDYILSVVYVAGVVLIQTDDEPPGPALPVLKRRVMALPFSLATIDSVNPQPVDLSASSPTQITLLGSNLDPADDAVFTTPGGTDLLTGIIQPGTGGDSLVVTLPIGLHAGVNAVQLTPSLPAPSSSYSSMPPRPFAQSNVAAFVLRPAILSILPGPSSGELVVTLSPSVGPKQQVSLLLNQHGGTTAPQAFSLPAASRATETSTLSFDITSIPTGSIPPEFFGSSPGSIPPGAYLARVRVDGAESPLEVDSSGTFSGPIVNIS
jgi:Pvc16 N-terminal domain